MWRKNCVIFLFLLNVLSIISNGRCDDDLEYLEMNDLNPFILVNASLNKVLSPELLWNGDEDKSFLLLTTPSGKVYFITQNAIIVSNRYGNNESHPSDLPYITYGSLDGNKYSVHSTSSGLPNLSLISGNPKEIGTINGIRLMSFVGLNRKRYRVSNHTIDEGAAIDDMDNSLEIVFFVKYQIFALTFTEGGSDLSEVVNCTDSVFLTISLPNGKVANLYQYIDEAHPSTLETDNAKSLPYITFNHVNGAAYDIQFSSNEDGSYNPTITKDRNTPRNKCIGLELFSFDGPDKKRYTIDVNNEKLYAVKDPDTVNESGEIELSFGVQLVTVKLDFLLGDPNDYKDDDAFYSKNSLHYRLGYYTHGLFDRFGGKPIKPTDDQSVSLKCLTSCVG